MPTRLAHSLTLATLLFAVAASTTTHIVAADVPITIADEGMPQFKIVVSSASTARTMNSAKTLADYLKRISGGSFEVTTESGESGIVLGLYSDFPGVPITKPWKDNDPTCREDYLLKTHSRGAWLLGATELAVEHAVWDFLYQLGHRQFFPSNAWEIIPKQKTLTIAFDSHKHPDYYARRIWYGYGAAAWSRTSYANWCSRNRATSGIEMRSGHAYDGILKRNKAEFDRHPEYLGLYKGERVSTKFCISNSSLRKLVADDAIKQLTDDPTLDSISVDPSDGGKWCECDGCRAIGTITDRAVKLANTVADAVNQRFPGKYVGMYAYNEHSPPPTIRVHPQVVINVATAFIRGGYSVEELMAGWKEKGATVGIREYYSVHTWDRDLPGKSRGSNSQYLQKTIPQFHKLGARFLSAESSDNWGCNGLGYYLASRMLWDVREADRIPELKADFFEKTFGPAKLPMEKFYSLIDPINRPLLTDDLLGRLYRELQDAFSKTDDAEIHARLQQLALYVRYLEHWTEYESSTGDQRQSAFESLARHGYRMRDSLMIHTVALVRDVPGRDKSVAIPRDARYTAPEDTNPWLDKTPFSAGEISQIISNGIAKRKLLDFEPVSFSTNLIPPVSLPMREMPRGSFGIYNRGVTAFFTWIDTSPATLSFKATGGIIYTNKGPANISLYPDAEPEGRSVSEVTIEADRSSQTVKLATTFSGLHRLQLSDHGAGTNVEIPPHLNPTICSSPESPAHLHGRWSLYFYVPKGTTVIGGFSDGPGTLRDPMARIVHKFTNKAGYFSIHVPKDTDGKAWLFDHCAGRRLLMTVPPYLAASPKELLLPEEIVKKDATP